MDKYIIEIFDDTNKLDGICSGWNWSSRMVELESESITQKAHARYGEKVEVKHIQIREMAPDIYPSIHEMRVEGYGFPITLINGELATAGVLDAEQLFQLIDKRLESNLPVNSPNKKRVLFVCTYNSARSQMAEALLNHKYGAYYEAKSAGINPSVINHYAIDAMKIKGIDISSQRSKNADEFMGQEFDYIISTCNKIKEGCFHISGGRIYVYHGFNDLPEKATDEQLRRLMDVLRTYIDKWIELFFDPELDVNKLF